MDWGLNLATALMVVVGGAVGIKLALRARHERQLADFAVALGLFCYATMAQGGRFLSLAIGPEAEPELQFAATTYRIVGYLITLVGLSIFTWRVFGAESRWRRGLCATLALSGICGSAAILRSSWLVVHGSEKLSSLWQLPLSLAFLVAFVWTSAESLRYYGLMRKRQSLGLADPAVTNRFLIWGAGAGLSTGLTMVPVVLTVSGTANIPLSQVATTSAGLVNALVWWLTFAPPAAYLRWLRRTSESASSGNANGKGS